MKKFFAFFLAVMMIMTFAMPVFAEDTPAAPAGNGSITINSAAVNEVYKIYKVLDLASYDADANAYLYTVPAEWADFFSSGAGAGYIQQVTNGNQTYVIWVAADKNEDTTVAALAKAALAWAEAKGITAISQTAASSTVTFTGLALGYYLVDSSLGSLCNLTTTDPTAEITEKNGLPTINKTVEEDSTGVYGAENDADTFQTINYKSEFAVKAGTVNNVVHDVMEPGLTFDSITSVTLNDAVVDPANYTVSTTTTDGCSFEIAFSDSYIASLTDGVVIVIKYTAHLNENAVIAGDGNKNSIWLTFGAGSKTEKATTTTYTYAFDLVKTDGNGKLLDGAEFNLVGYSFKSDANGYYVVAAGTENATNTLVVSGGVITVRGLDSATYSLLEVKAPAGYNLLNGSQSFTINKASLSATVDLAQKTYTTGGVQVVNQTGTVLPETGGFGTTLFVVLGGLTVLTAGVLLFVKKRMEQVAE